ncbi:phenylalanyl-tRNA synthetase [Planoprotostelium fungivorum]|uniref:phenylalanine--tRNA ligase n=1 Tax=Planoprotostelium fungivorum TaxID=1890364 RepID=A0A2P6NCA0_9EUKA|nr:phenylalanyl-tRNA synthetase [Planoprotostelium fungivorum]
MHGMLRRIPTCGEKRIKTVFTHIQIKRYHSIGPLSGIDCIYCIGYLSRGNELTPTFTFFDNLNPIVSTHKCFDSLLTPKDHVSRRPSDTYYINKDTVLRTHTSAHQTELMSNHNNAFLVTGDVYRRDEIDSTHYPIFHQMEGVRIFERKQFGNLTEDQQNKIIEEDLKKWLQGAITAIFGQELQMKWVDAYFPFTHPSFELEIYFREKWLEMLGCGLVHQDILKSIGLRDHVGWAFGLGLERLAMVLFQIPDIRLFWSQDERFKSQFTRDEIIKFQEYSKYPPCIKDISFWIDERYQPNDFFEMVRGVGGDLIESVQLADRFVHPKTKRESHCYRINFRSMDRSLTHDEINQLQQSIRDKSLSELKLDLR